MKGISTFISAFLAVLLLTFALSVSVSADGGNTTLTAEVPCTVSMQIGEHGKVTVNGTDYTGEASVTVEMNAVLTYAFKPALLYQLDKVIYNGEDVTAEVSGGSYTAPALTGNAALSVSFKFIAGGGTETYSVTFDANGHGTAPAAQTVLDGNTAAKPADPTADGWTFGGWYREASCVTAFDFTEPIKESITLYAKWTENPTPLYTVTFDSAGGSEVEAQTVKSGEKANRPADPVKKGYTFEGWYRDKTCGIGFDFTDPITQDITLWAKWSKNATPTTPEIPYIPYFPVIPKPVVPVTAPTEPETPTKPTLPFIDVTADSPFYDDISYVYENDIMNGMSDTEFGENLPLTRGMIVTILWRVEGRPAVTYTGAFTDVPDGMWYTDGVEWAASHGIVLGYGDGRYGPNDNVTREQLAAILFRYAKYKGYDVSVGEDTNILGYYDYFEIGEWAIPAMQWACGSGVLEDDPYGWIRPTDPAIRGEIAHAIHIFMEEVAK